MLTAGVIGSGTMLLGALIRWAMLHKPIVLSGALAMTGIPQLMTLLVLLPCIHVAAGFFFSFSWRRGGHLAVPATVHACIGAVRNMLT